MKQTIQRYFPGVPPELRDVSEYALFAIAPTRSRHGFSRVECERIIKTGQARSPVVATVGKRSKSWRVKYEAVADVRSATVFELAPNEETLWIYDRILRLAQLANQRHWQFMLSGVFHPLKLIRYEVGDHYTWHTDLGAGTVSDRKLSVTAQLSAPASYSGGDLQLVAGPAPVSAPRDRGVLVVFPSYVLHRVAPITRGVRFALVTWIQGPPFR